MAWRNKQQQGFSPDYLCETLDLLSEDRQKQRTQQQPRARCTASTETQCYVQGARHPSGQPKRFADHEGLASRAPSKPSNTTTLGQWCQQGCPNHLLCCGRQRKEHGPPKTQDKEKQSEGNRAACPSRLGEGTRLPLSFYVCKKHPATGRHSDCPLCSSQQRGSAREGGTLHDIGAAPPPPSHSSLADWVATGSNRQALPEA